MKKPQRLAVYIFDMSDKLTEYCRIHNINASQATRIALAQLLNCEVPDIKAGNPTFASKEPKHDC